jgi:hypothetical protein
MNPVRLASFLLAASLVALLPGAPGAQAGVEPPNYGAEARCIYKAIDVDLIKLRRIRIMPPTMLLGTDEAPIVGWRFIIQRRSLPTGPPTAWKQIFASRIQKSAALPGEPGDFTPMTANIRMPALPPIGMQYRVRLRFYWFEEGGSRLLVSQQRVAEYDVYLAGEQLWTDSLQCEHAWLFE